MQNIFSIIVPMYNVENYIEKCINSVLQQTYEKFEILIIDDGSIDKSVEIIRQYQKRDGRIKLLQVKHGGQANARNLGIEYAVGDYITFLDADDYWAPEHLKLLNKELGGCDMCIANNHIDCLGMEEQVITLFEVKEGRYYSCEEVRCIVTDKKIFLPGATWLNTYRREFLNENKIRFNPSFSCAEDMDLFFNALEKAKEIHFCCHRFYYYRIDNINSTIRNMNAEKMIHRGKVYKKWFDYYQIETRGSIVADNIRHKMSLELVELVYDLHRIPRNDSKRKELKDFLKDNQYIYNSPYKWWKSYKYIYYIRYITRKIERKLKQMLDSKVVCYF